MYYSQYRSLINHHNSIIVNTYIYIYGLYMDYKGLYMVYNGVYIYIIWLMVEPTPLKNVKASQLG